MIREMELRQFSPCTIESYQTAVSGLSQFYHRSPDQLNLEEIRSYLHHLLTERKVAQSTCNQRAAGLTFFYRHVLGQEAFDLKIRRKHSGKLPEVYSQQELVRLFDAARNRRDRVLLMTTYAAGLRLKEVQHLQPIHIHAQRQLIRVEQGKGQKDRYTLLSPQLLLELRAYWKEYRPPRGCFNSENRANAAADAQDIFYTAKRRADSSVAIVCIRRGILRDPLARSGVDLHHSTAPWTPASTRPLSTCMWQKGSATLRAL
jgi:site-specific recombinase XerD